MRFYLNNRQLSNIFDGAYYNSLDKNYIFY